MSLLTPEHVLLASTARSKRALITELAKTLSSMDLDQVMEVVMAREQLGSTGIGHGVAIPHGRLPELSQPVVAIARHSAGVDFDAIDGQPVHIIIMLLVPEDASRQHLELLAYLARIFQQEHLRQAVMNAESIDDILQLFPDLTQSG
ncbi:MAG TPA: PTS sugar transporter subunit IIA [Mariprofundaceae bacterium]|nr:PTS sugar transporter subunit IIA [Mariprofundaceae bacterium]